MAREIADSEISSLILIHGGGSFGHPLAKKYQLNIGFRNPLQLLGFSETHTAMVSLNLLIVKSLIEERIPAFSLSPSTLFVTKNGRIYAFEDETLKKALKLGLVPVLYGDVTLDSETGFAILSGDQIAGFLAVKLGAELIIMGVDVNGLYTEDPKSKPSAKFIPHLTLKELEKLCGGLGGSKFPDVTGGMGSKILELVSPIRQGTRALIVNALIPGNIRNALKGEPSIGTEITEE